MGSCCTADAPTPPNPYQTASAQTGTNVSTALANSYLNNVNQNTPQGSLSHDVTGNYAFTDPTSGATYQIPRWTSTQTLNPTGQATFEQNQQSQLNMAGMANQQSGMLQSMLGTPFDPNKGSFNAQQYLAQNPDVANWAQSSGMPLDQAAAQHYRQSGQMEGRGTGGQAAPGAGDIGLFNQVQGPQSQFADAGSIQNNYASGGDIQRGFDPNAAGQIRTGYNSGGDITRTYGPSDNYSADRQRIEQSMFERVNPQLQQDEQRLRQQLADQGIRYGSQAYSGAYDPYNRAVTDTRLGIVQAGGQEQQRMDQMAAQRAQFQNAAQQQGYQQNAALAAFGNQAQQQGYAQQLGLGQFRNAAQQQAEGQNAARAAFGNQAQQSQYGQNLGRASFFNQAQNQQLGLSSAKFNAENQLRNQNLQEQYQQRNQPINEITALLSGSQVSSPNFINASKTQIPTTDVAGLINQNFAQQNDIYKTDQAFWGDIIGGGLGAAGKVGAAYASDVRVKENIAPMGSIMSPKGELPIYAYDYKDDFDDGKRHVGPMAQDVEKIAPDAVKTIDGVKHIKRDKLGSIFGSRG